MTVDLLWSAPPNHHLRPKTKHRKLIFFWIQFNPIHTTSYMFQSNKVYAYIFGSEGPQIDWNICWVNDRWSQLMLRRGPMCVCSWPTQLCLGQFDIHRALHSRHNFIPNDLELNNDVYVYTLNQHPATFNNVITSKPSRLYCAFNGNVHGTYTQQHYWKAFGRRRCNSTP